MLNSEKPQFESVSVAPDRLVIRTSLIDRLCATESPFVSIIAPAGYGKSTLLEQWMAADPRPTARVSLDRVENDPVILFDHITSALTEAGLMTPTWAAESGLGSDPEIVEAVQLVAGDLEDTQVSGILMLDQLECLHSLASRRILTDLAARLPSRITLVASSRSSAKLPLSTYRPRGDLVEVSATDLAMDASETRELLRNAGIDIGDDLQTVVEQTEGWPVAVHLVAIAATSDSTAKSGSIGVHGDDRFIAGYLRREVFAHMSHKRRKFLLRTSIADHLTGDLCDELLETTGSGNGLAKLHRAGVPLVPLDHTEDSYRHHRLFGEFLRSELQRTEPELVPVLHGRAAAWHEANDMADVAIHHAQAAGDVDTVFRLVIAVGRETFSTGHIEDALGWLGWFDKNDHLPRDHAFTATGALSYALVGDVAAADRWGRVAFGGAETDPEIVEPVARVVRSLFGASGVEQMYADAVSAKKNLPPDSDWYAATLVAEGMACLCAGDVDAADEVLARAASAGQRYKAPMGATFALAIRSIIASDRGNWTSAETLAADSTSLVREYGIETAATSGLPFVAAARCASHRGEIEEARRLLAQAATVRPRLSAALLGVSVLTLLEMAVAFIKISDVGGARQVMRTAGDLLRGHDLGALGARYTQTMEILDALPAGNVGASSLTTAELRLLPLLATHLSFPEIGDQLFISRHTVKTQAMSVYRKLNASSRSEAVGRARGLGLLED